MKSLFYLIVFTLALISCKKVDCDIYTNEVTYQTIEKSALYGNGDEEIGEENFVITSDSEWTTLIDKIDAANNVSDDFDNVPVNFDEQIVIACFDQVRPNGGYSLSISQVEYNGSQLEVSIEKSGGSGMTTSVITQPFHIIVLDKCEKNPDVTFQ
ncbi:MAG: protease complex subunit PrcB family protein [Crocinitomicaceae bacterium]